MPRPSLVELLPFSTPQTPDLGCFVNQKHGLETINFPVYEEPSPWEIVAGNLEFFAHQVYFRVKCGKASFFERCLVYMRDAYASANDIIGLLPDFVLGGDYRPHPSEWLSYPPQAAGRAYFFLGEHRDPSQVNWSWDAAVGHDYDIYDYGTLATVQWDDAGGDRDFNDLVVEVAVIRRPLYFTGLKVAEADPTALASFKSEIEPGLRTRRPPRNG